MHKILAFVLLLFVIQSRSAHLAAQDINNGKVTDEKGTPLKDVQVSINNRLDFTTNSQGEFHFILPKGSKLSDLQATKKGYKLKKWDFREADKMVAITMQTAGSTVLKGKVVDEKNAPVKGVQVILDGVNSVNIVVTGTGGTFSMKLPPEANPDKIGFIVNGTLVSKSGVAFSAAQDFVTLKVAGLKAGKASESTPDQKPAGQNTEKGEVTPVVNPTKKTPLVHPKPVINIEVYDERNSPISGLEIFVDGKMYVTDSHGEFQLKAMVTDDIQFVINGYEIERRDFDENDIYLYLKKKEDPLSPDPNPYQQDFHRVVDQLELKKQLLAEKSIHIREEIDDITNRLKSEPPISPEQRIKLKQYLRNLETSLIESEVAFEEAEEKTQIVVDRMRSVIIEKDSLNHLNEEKLEKTEHEKRIAELELMISAIIGIALLILSIVFYRLAKRLKKQKDEIHQQHLEIEHAYQNVKALSDIGQKITSTLDFKTIIQTVNHSIHSVIDTSTFAVGIFNPLENKIEFTDFISDGEAQEYHYESLHDPSKYSVWAFKNRMPVVINDLEKDFEKYPVEIDKTTLGKMPKSLVYMPLVIENKPVGVIVMQSLKANAYSAIDLRLIETLSSYLSVALANANAYQVIKGKNKHITDSIRYAQTIQQAVLPGDKQISEVLREYFVIYRPKDIVSGDFYWLDHIPAQNGNPAKTFFAVIDCTGHGVPGGFMSMVANHLLSEIVNVKSIYDPALVLEQLDLRVREALKQYDKVNDDGMDICLCLMEACEGDTSKTRVTFSGARRPLYYFTQAEGKFEQLKGDRASIGGMQHKEHAFTNQELILSTGDYLYLTTDGLADQNDVHRVKFTTVKLKNMLAANAHLSAAEQQHLLETTLDTYMQGVEQRDDITLVGIRI